MKSKSALSATLVVFCLAVLSTAALCQPRGPKPPIPSERAQQMKKDLGLTDAQTIKIKAIFEEQEKVMRKAFGPPPGGGMGEPSGPPPGDPEEMREAMMEMQTEMDKKISAVLTPKQKKKYDALEKEKRNQFQFPPPPEE